MTEQPLSPSTRALLDACKGDRPDEKTRDEMWRGVDRATRFASIGALGAVAANTKTTSIFAGGIAKLAAIGFAGVVTIGVSIGVMHARSSKYVQYAPIATYASSVEGTSHVTIEPHPIATDSFAVAEVAHAAASTSTNTNANAIVPAKQAVLSTSKEDGLMREAQLVSDARVALHRGDAESALTLVRRTSSLPTRELEPEELSLEAAALHALGKDDDAMMVEMRLRLGFPNNKLVGAH